MSLERVVLLLSIASFVTACGGSDDGGSVKTGVFIDSAVEGLSFSTPSQSGLTNATGEFRYKDGEVVTFTIGNVDIGSAFGAEYLSPLDITNSFLPSDATASNVARLLQTLDMDGDPENGISLPASVAALPGDLDVNDTAAVEALLGQALTSAAAAESHLEASISALPPRAVEGVYQRVTIGSTGLPGCPDVIDAEVNVSRDAAGERVYEGKIDLANGDQYLFTADDSTIRKPSVAADPDHQYRVTLNTHEGAILILATAVGPGSRCAEIRLTTDTAVNLPPIVRPGLHVTKAPGCVSDTSTYSLTMSFYAHDKDGFIVNDIEVKFALEGNPLTTLVNQGDTSSCERVPRAMGWDPASPSNGGWYCTLDNAVLDDIPCGAGFSWEMSATDNEGLTSTVTGGSSAPRDVEPITGDLYQCWENYPAEACEIAMSSAPSGTTITSHAAGSCASLVPEPRATVSATEVLDGFDTLQNLIVNYDSSLGSGVSCLTTLEIPSF
jgi:hypothetical protein